MTYHLTLWQNDDLAVGRVEAAALEEALELGRVWAEEGTWPGADPDRLARLIVSSDDDTERTDKWVSVR